MIFAELSQDKSEFLAPPSYSEAAGEGRSRQQLKPEHEEDDGVEGNWEFVPKYVSYNMNCGKK